MVDLAADVEEERDAGAAKKEAKAEKEKESSLYKWVRKVTAAKESIVERQRICMLQLRNTVRTLEKGKEKEKAFEVFTVSMKNWN